MPQGGAFERRLHFIAGTKLFDVAFYFSLYSILNSIFMNTKNVIYVKAKAGACNARYTYLMPEQKLPKATTNRAFHDRLLYIKKR